MKLKVNIENLDLVFIVIFIFILLFLPYITWVDELFNDVVHKEYNLFELFIFATEDRPPKKIEKIPEEHKQAFIVFILLTIFYIIGIVLTLISAFLHNFIYYFFLSIFFLLIGITGVYGIILMNQGKIFPEQSFMPDFGIFLWFFGSALFFISSIIKYKSKIKELKELNKIMKK